MTNSSQTRSFLKLYASERQKAESVNDKASIIEAVSTRKNQPIHSTTGNSIDVVNAGQVSEVPELFQLKNLAYDAPIPELSARTGAPLALARGIAEQRLAEWMSRPIEIDPFRESPPSQPIFVAPPVLTKTEFETTQSFEQRLMRAQALYDTKVAAQRDEYKRRVNAYNNVVKDYNSYLELERAARREQLERMRWEYINQALQHILGDPTLVEATYNADAETFFVDLVSPKAEFRRTLTTNIPLELAPIFKSQLNKARPIISFNLDEAAELIVRDIIIEFQGSNYVANIAASKIVAVEKTKTLRATNEAFQVLPLIPLEAANSDLSGEHKNFGAGLNRKR